MRSDQVNRWAALNLDCFVGSGLICDPPCAISMLSDVLEDDVPRKYWLSRNSAQVILANTAAAGKTLPSDILAFLEATAAGPSPSEADA